MPLGSASLARSARSCAAYMPRIWRRSSARSSPATPNAPTWLRPCRRALHGVPLEVTQLLQQALTLPVSSLSVLVHGDLHVRHALVDQDGHATGIIDWGDISLAHPSVDLQIGWSGFAGEARSALLAAYGPIPDEWRLRARVSALFYSASLATLAHRDGLAALEREARSGLRRACTE